jgi:hypothetical protein
VNAVELYVKVQVMSALTEVAKSGPWADVESIALQLIEALDDRDVMLRPR